MTRASVRDRILKDVNSDINDHLRNHVHLTNCIHLKNHMHSKHSPILADRALVRDFIVLQRSRSLRDPSPSPSWHSPSVVDMLLKRGDLSSGRRSVNTRHHRKKLSESSPQVTGLHEASESAIGEVSRRNHGLTSGLSERGNRDGTHQHDRIAEKEESSKRFLEEGSVQVRSPELGSKSYYKNKGGYEKDSQLRTISDRIIDVIDESDDAAFSHNHGKGKIEKESEERGVNDARGRVNRAKRRKFRGARRNRLSTASAAAETENEISVASNSYARSRYNQKSHVEKSTYDDHNITGVPRNGCGIPLNWSRIHDRGKSLLDMAGRSLSCGLSEPRFKRGGSTSKILDMPVMSEDSSESTRSEREAFPLLFDASGSQGSVGRASWLNNYSGELGIFADDLLKQDEIDSEFASEGRSHERHKLQRHNHRNKRHQSLTQKYTPKMFRDVVGQNLVVQALSNAIAKRKIGLHYVFYGPRGTGKTSCARVFSRALNCESIEYPKPCGFCDSCVSLDMGKSTNVREIGPVSSSMGFEDIIELLESMKTLKHQSWYRVLIFDECDMLSSESWSAVLKIVDRAPRRVVFVLVCSSLDALPHVIISRCQKFFFPKLKEADIIYALQWIASKEDIEIDKDALKLIASKSDGSLRDAEMTLEQLSLIGKRISVGLVQELVGLISDEKLVDLLDLALSADTINTVKNLRDIMESGVEPLALMSQLATVITDILAGSYDFVKERPRMRFFKRQSLSKEDMEKLRQALKTLSEAEKQLRASSDRITWLTAALLQLAPDQQYVLPSSSAESFNNSPLGGVNNNDYSIREIPRKSNVESSQQKDNDKMNGIRPSSDSHRKIDDIWFEVLAQLPTDSLKEFMYQEAKLVSVSYGAAPTVQLLFKSHQSKSKAEKFRLHILQAFESVLRSPITIEIRCDSRKESGPGPILLPPHDVSDLENPVITHTKNRFPSASQDEDVNRRNQSRDNISAGVNIREIIELNNSSGEYKASRRKDESTRSRAISSKASDERKLSASLSLVRGKVSLARVIQDRYSQQHNGGWSKNKAVSIAEKLEQENLRLEPRSRGLRCWNPPKFTRRKLSRLKIKTRKPQMLLKFMSCGKCLSVRSPRQN